MHSDTYSQLDTAAGRWEFGPRSDEDDGLADLGYEAALPGLQLLCMAQESDARDTNRIASQGL